MDVGCRVEFEWLSTTSTFLFHGITVSVLMPHAGLARELEELGNSM
jgi:hypothetical protein